MEDEALDPQRDYWLIHLRVSFGIFVLEVLAVAVYLASTPHGTHRGALFAICLACLLSALASLVAAPLVARRPWRYQFSLVWAVAANATVGVAATLDGGPHSPILYLVFLPVMAAALVFRPGGVILCGLTTVGTVAAVAATAPTVRWPQDNVFLLLAVAAGASILAVAASANRSRLEASERELTAQLARLARTDYLTGCLNHGAFGERLRAEVARAVRYSQPLSLAMIDVDHFKVVNDTFGHLVGDEVLGAVGKLLLRWSRATDVVGRIGGDEFALLMPHTPSSDALVHVEHLRVRCAGVDPQPVTLSVGISDLDLTHPRVEQLRRDADRALYQVKHDGRDGVAVAPSNAATAVHPHRHSPSALPPSPSAPAGTAIGTTSKRVRSAAAEPGAAGTAGNGSKRAKGSGPLARGDATTRQ
jgi:diguanylate cyclase (GGDEF)-like protein